MGSDKTTRILEAATAAFLRHGFRRVGMNDIAAAAGISRPALYLVFNSKEAVFRSAHARWVSDIISEIENRLPSLSTPVAQLRMAFELWVVAQFEAIESSSEAKELLECTLAFAKDSLDDGYARFEHIVAPLVGAIVRQADDADRLPPERLAHLLVSSVRGLKEAAKSADDLRGMIEDSLTLISETPRLEQRAAL